MNNKKTILINRIKFFAALLFVYVVIFQFILPVNKFLPKPSLFIESFIYIWRDYQLLIAIGYTASLVYFSLIIGYLLIFIFRVLLIKFVNKFHNVILTLHLFRFVPLFFILMFISYWFPTSIFAEYAFVVIIVIFHFLQRMQTEVDKVKNEYLVVARNLGVTNNKIYGQVYWKELQPGLFDSINRLHIYLWSFVLVYEFVCDAHGLGSTIRNSLAFGDFIALIYCTLFVTLISWCFGSLMKLVERKIVFWNK